MRSRTLLLVLLAALAAAAVASSAAPADAAAKAKVVRLKAFQTCGNLIRYGNRHSDQGMPQHFADRQVGAPAPTSQGVAGGGQDEASRPAPAAAAPVAGTDFSTTNVQEAGVDEPDIVKTDGSKLFAIAAGKLRAVDVSVSPPKLVGTLALADGYGHQLLLRGTKLLVMWTASSAPVARGASTVAPGYYQPQTVLGEVDVSDPAAMKLVRTLTIDGTLVSSRLNGRTARVIVQSVPGALRAAPPQNPTPQPGPSAAPGGDRASSAAKYHRTRDPKRAAAWLPSAVRRDLRRGTAKRRAIVACRAVRRTTAFSGLGMLTVMTLDLSKGLQPIDSDSLMTGAETVYASERSLYVATQRFYEALQTPDPARIPSGLVTSIHKFDISDQDATTYRGSGNVPGFLLSQFSMSEHKGKLRVASTSTPTWVNETAQPSQSFVTVLDEVGTTLTQLGQVSGLGKGERIYSVRFIGDAGYVVTFRQVDPLYTIDVSNPAKPTVLGELKILGYSAYLHPVSDTQLLGVGQDATEEGRRLGAQLSLFDVSDLRNPKRLHQKSIGSSSTSEAEYDHHAFLYWPKTRLAVLPVSIYGDGRESTPFTGAIGFRVDPAAGIGEAGRVSHDGGGYAAQVRRSVVVGENLLTLSDAGVKASRLDTLAEVGWVPFG